MESFFQSTRFRWVSMHLARWGMQCTKAAASSSCRLAGVQLPQQETEIVVCKSSLLLSCCTSRRLDEETEKCHGASLFGEYLGARPPRCHWAVFAGDLTLDWMFHSGRPSDTTCILRKWRAGKRTRDWTLDSH